MLLKKLRVINWLQKSAILILGDFVLKTKYQTDKAELENKISDASNLVTKTKLTELEKKILDISNLATKTALTTVENKTSSVSNLVKKQTITQKLLKLKINFMIIIMINS